MDTELDTNATNASHNAEVSSLASNLRAESFAIGEMSTFSTLNESAFASQNTSDWSAVNDFTIPPTYHNLSPSETPSTSQSTSNDTGTNVLKVVRMCPSCHKSVEDLLSHYAMYHGTWDENDKRDYLALERRRIEKSVISEDHVQTKLQQVGCGDEKVLSAVKELLLECGIKTVILHKKEFSPNHPFVMVWKNWLIQKKRLNANDNEEFEIVCKMLSYIFDESAPMWNLLIRRKNRIAHFVRSRKLTNKPVDMAATAVKSLQTFRNFVIISLGSKTNTDEDTIPEDQYRDFMNFLDEETYKFRRIINKQTMEKPAAAQAKRNAAIIRATGAIAGTRNVRNATTAERLVADVELEKVSEAEWRSGYHFTEKWKKFAMSKLYFESFLQDEILARGDHVEMKRVRQTVFQVAKGLWQRFQVSQVLLDYKGDFKDAEAAKQFYLSEVAKRRWPVANLARSFNGVLSQFRNGYRPRRVAFVPSSGSKRPAMKDIDISIDEVDIDETTLHSVEKRSSVWDLGSSSDEDFLDDSSIDHSPLSSREQKESVGAQTVQSALRLQMTRESRSHMTPRTAALRRTSTASSSTTSNDSDYLRIALEESSMNWIFRASFPIRREQVHRFVKLETN
ncbi:unnamed protein product [Toxocara canis]|uniref:C2H2-type domain-containing protein n=1 Tax=Toxocara canis TaxID=6265 RepID=A0A183UQX3_TOXCA|nr:unnamed protein product [Toxocara canis]